MSEKARSEVNIMTLRTWPLLSVLRASHFLDRIEGHDAVAEVFHSTIKGRSPCSLTDVQGNTMQRKQWGMFFIALSCLFYAALFTIPFLSMTKAQSGVLASCLIIVGEVSFAVGGIIAGKSLVADFRSKFVPKRFQKRSESPLIEEE